MRRLVLVGGGHAHIEVLRDLGERPDERWEVSLVTPYPLLLYSGMVPGLVAGHYGFAECAINLRALAARARAAFLQTSASLVNPLGQEVMCANSTVLTYDVLSLDVGSKPFTQDAQGVERHAIAVRPLEKMAGAWEETLSRARAAKVTSITVVGGGAAGVELALAMEYRLRREFAQSAPHVRVIANTPTLLPEFPPAARRRLRARMLRRGIGAHVASAVTEVGGDYVRLEGGLEFASDLTFWVAGAAAHEWIRESGFATDQRGFLLTNDFLQSVTYRNVFGVGDCATQEGRAFPKAGVFAVRAAPVLAANLRAELAREPLKTFDGSARYLALVSAGERFAVGVWDRFAWEGHWVWRWKDHIDRRFVARYAGSPA